MKKLILAVALAVVPTVAFVAAPEQAEADTVDGYVCTVQTRNAVSSSENPYGSTVFSLYTQPACAGSYLKTMTACSTTSYGNACFTNVPYQLTHAALARAVAEDVRVSTVDWGWLSSTTLQHATLEAD